jgi:hypothetical protein
MPGSSITGATPTGASGAIFGGVSCDAVDALSLLEAVVGDGVWGLLDAFGVVDIPAPSAIYALRDTLRLNAPTSMQAALQFTGADRLGLTSRIWYIANALANDESLSLTSELSLSTRTTLRVAEAVALSGAFSLQAETNAAGQEALSLLDSIRSLWAIQVDESAAMTDEPALTSRVTQVVREVLALRSETTTQLSISPLCADLLALAERIWFLQAVQVDETLDLESPAQAITVVARRIVERLIGVSSTTAQMTLTGSLVDSLTALSRIWITADVQVDESAALTTENLLTSVANRLVNEVIALTTQPTFTVELAIAITEAWAALDVLQYVQAMTAEETITLASDLTAAIRAQFQTTEAFALDDGVSFSLVILAPESLILDSTSTPTVSMLLQATETLAFVGHLPLEEGDYSAWVMNAETTGTTSYSNFPFNSLVDHNGVTYGLTDTGLYRLEGATDDGADIMTTLRTGDMDFGSSREKNVPRAYLYVLTNGDLVLKTISTTHGARTERNYALTARTTDAGDDETLRRVPLARGLRGTWWSFELHNVDGAAVEFKGAEVLPVVLSRRG